MTYLLLFLCLLLLLHQHEGIRISSQIRSSSGSAARSNLQSRVSSRLQREVCVHFPQGCPCGHPLAPPQNCTPCENHVVGCPCDHLLAHSECQTCEQHILGCGAVQKKATCLCASNARLVATGECPCFTRTPLPTAALAVQAALQKAAHKAAKEAAAAILKQGASQIEANSVAAAIHASYILKNTAPALAEQLSLSSAFQHLLPTSFLQTKAHTSAATSSRAHMLALQQSIFGDIFSWFSKGPKGPPEREYCCCCWGGGFAGPPEQSSGKCERFSQACQLVTEGGCGTTENCGAAWQQNDRPEGITSTKNIEDYSVQLSPGWRDTQPGTTSFKLGGHAVEDDADLFPEDKASIG